MKTYSFKKGREWIESDYPPFDLAWRPQPYYREKRLWVGVLIKWLILLGAFILCAGAIYQGLKALWPGL